MPKPVFEDLSDFLNDDEFATIATIAGFGTPSVIFEDPTVDLLDTAMSVIAIEGKETELGSVPKETAVTVHGINYQTKSSPESEDGWTRLELEKV